MTVGISQRRVRDGKNKMCVYSGGGGRLHNVSERLLEWG